MILAAHNKLILELVELNLGRRERLNFSQLTVLRLDLNVPLRGLLTLLYIKLLRHVLLDLLSLLRRHQGLAIIVNTLSIIVFI